MALQRLHWPALTQLRREIAAVGLARRNYLEAKEFAAKMGIRHAYPTYQDLLSDANIDAVLIAVPIELNGTVLLDAIRAGKHVMAEKPIAATVCEARTIVQAAERSSQIVLIGENFRYRPDLALAKQLVESGSVGDIFAFQLKVNFDITAPSRQPWISRGWRHEARHHGGFILDAGVHPVAALRDVLGEVNSVSAQTLDNSSVVHGPDSLLMQVRMESGVVGHCFFCYTAKEAKESPLDFAIFGTKGVLRVAPSTVTIVRGGESPREVTRTKAKPGEYLNQWRNFGRAIRGEEQVISTARKAYGDLAVIDAALSSSESGGPVLVGKIEP